MAVDSEIRGALVMMGQKLKDYRGARRVVDVESATNIDKTTIYGIERGDINWTIDKVATLLAHYGTSLEDFLTGFKPSKAEADRQEFYRLLNIILDSGKTKQIDGIRVNLDAIADKCIALVEADARSSGEEAPKAGRPHKPRRRASVSKVGKLQERARDHPDPIQGREKNPTVDAAPKPDASRKFKI
jgi:hypothetical protein